MDVDSLSNIVPSFNSQRIIVYKDYDIFCTCVDYFKDSRCIHVHNAFEHVRNKMRIIKLGVLGAFVAKND